MTAQFGDYQGRLRGVVPSFPMSFEELGTRARAALPRDGQVPQFGGVPGFFKLYPPDDRELAASLVHRAETAGFKGIVVTLDTWLTGWRPRHLSTSNFPQPRGNCLAPLPRSATPGLPGAPATCAGPGISASSPSTSKACAPSSSAWSATD